MENEAKNLINKDLILREKLAIHRTQMANTTTLLAFMRTALYFFVAGLSLNNLLDISYGKAIEIACLMIGAGMIITGVFQYQKVKRKIKESMQHIGNYKLDYINDAIEP